MFRYESAFNQPLSFDTSRVTDMDSMFWVRARAPLHLPFEPPAFRRPRTTRLARRFLSRFRHRRSIHTRVSRPTHFVPHIAHALLSTLQGASSLSDANKVLISCAWAGTAAFVSAGYATSPLCRPHHHQRRLLAMGC